MSERLLPDAILGSWYVLPERGNPFDARDDDGQLIAFRPDGAFRRYRVDSTEKDLQETGDYTFDGDFLILRGANTDTFRVHVAHPWSWLLEAKKKTRRLLRGLVGADDFFELSDEQRQQLRTTPRRVDVKSPYRDDADAIFDLIFKPNGRSRRRIATFSVDAADDSGPIWVGLTPLATNLDDEHWRRLIQHAYLRRYRGDSERADSLRVDLVGTTAVSSR